MAKSRKSAGKLKAVKAVKEEVVEATLPEDLQQKWTACEAVATTFNVIQKGMFPTNALQVVNASLAFLQKLHEQTVEDAVSHPSSDLIPELKKLKEQRAQDGKSTEA